MFATPKVTKSSILASHRNETVSRCKSCDERIYAIQDTTDVTVNNNRHLSNNLGHNTRVSKDNLSGGNSSYHIHTTLCISASSVPLGIIEQEIYTHNNNNSSLRKSRKQRPIEEKESYRWLKSLYACREYLGDSDVVLLSDRESDIYEYLNAAQEESQHVILRSRGDRKEIVELLPNMRSAGKYSFVHEDNQTAHTLSVFYNAFYPWKRG